MIGRIEGKVIDRGATHLLVDVHGVGYEIEIPLSTYVRIASADTVTLHTHLVVREDAQLLYGFSTPVERELFRALIKVNRVGPKLALTIMSGMDGSSLAECIRNEDARSLSALPGVGKKTADQMIIDLRDKLPEFYPVVGGRDATSVASGGSLADAESALVGLGFKPQEAARALATIADDKADVATLIKQALKALG